MVAGAKKPRKMTDGFIIGGGLLAAGVLLQCTIGPVQWYMLRWPVNIISLAVLLSLIGTIYFLRRHVNAFQFFATNGAAVPALAYAVVLTMVMGLTRQSSSAHNGENLWLSDMLTFWPFVLIYTYITVILGLVVLKQLRMWATTHFSLFALHFSLLSHLGLFITITTATLGNADMQRLQMWTTNNPEMANMLAGTNTFMQYERFAIDAQGRRVELPLAIELKRFIMEMHDDSITPRRFASEVVVYSKESLHQYGGVIDVNKPMEVDGWKIYQKDYRLTDAGDACQVSILELVSDPWLPWVYAGIIMMLGGALLILTSRRTNR